MNTLEGLLKEIKEAHDWMVDSAGQGVEATPEELAKESGDIYEVIVSIYLVNGELVILRNKCKESYIRDCYVGDNIYVDDNVVYAEYDDSQNRFHQVRINPEHIVMLDMYTEEVDWKNVKKKEF